MKSVEPPKRARVRLLTPRRARPAAIALARALLPDGALEGACHYRHTREREGRECDTGHTRGGSGVLQRYGQEVDEVAYRESHGQYTEIHSPQGDVFRQGERSPHSRQFRRVRSLCRVRTRRTRLRTEASTFHWWRRPWRILHLRLRRRGFPQKVEGRLQRRRK